MKGLTEEQKKKLEEATDAERKRRIRRQGPLGEYEPSFCIGGRNR